MTSAEESSNLEQAFADLNKNKEKIEQLLANEKGDLGPNAIQALENSRDLFQDLIPSFSKILDSVREIKDYVLKPVTYALEDATRQSIEEIKKTSEKGTRVSKIWGITGLVVGIFGLLSAFLSSAGIFDHLRSKIIPLVYDSHPTQIHLLQQIENDLEGDIESKLAEFYSTTNDLCLRMDNCADTLKEEFINTFSNLNLKDLSTEIKTELELAYLLIKILEQQKSKNNIEINRIAKEIEFLNKHRSRNTSNKIAWYQGEVFRLQGMKIYAIEAYKRIPTIAKEEVFDFSSKQFVNVYYAANRQVNELERSTELDSIKIYLFNSSVANVSGLAESAKQRLEEEGYNGNLIFTTNDPHGRSSLVYSYIRSERLQLLGSDIQNIIFENKKNVLWGDTLEIINSKSNYEIQNYFNNKNLDADIVIRIPNE